MFTPTVVTDGANKRGRTVAYVQAVIVVALVVDECNLGVLSEATRIEFEQHVE
ncbi:hypothetical protein OKW50_007540 [Paraburkholderia youngii]|uniref:hypothetical protein n=1 Tax=Paraburkholderia youngii TaxID=2782701 RepID=UPI003D202090